MKMKKYLSIIVCMAIVFSFASCGQPKQEVKDADPTVDLKGMSGIEDDESVKNILQIAAGSEDHTTLVAAVLAAGLEDVLANPGPLTVFAPVNSAFDALPEGTVDFLLKPENKDSLIHIITYHAAPGTYKGKMLKGIMGIGQATGEKVVIEKIENGYTVNGANILATIEASNGVIHVVDQVLLPPAK
jgi:uncharacterized surface protein with fasciclin (FAS1) repeats